VAEKKENKTFLIRFSFCLTIQYRLSFKKKITIFLSLPPLCQHRNFLKLRPKHAQKAYERKFIKKVHRQKEEDYKKKK